MKAKTGAVVFILFVIAVMQTAGHSLDVCSSCHANATCDDKPDRSGKVCNCKYGFVGNGRTFCQDKDECQIGSVKICGQHTTCHNTYGSYYCTCLFGYSPSNNMATFIPNDGTNCQDIDECHISGICGEGALCKNLEGSFDCRCQIGYKVHGGAEPFNPHKDKATCKVVDCGAPVLAGDSVLVSVTKHTFGGVAMFKCDQGFMWRRGNNASVCEASGRWTAPSMVCEEILCGSLPIVDNTVHVWDGKLTLGSTVEYYCKYGFYDNGGHNSSVCNENGKWTQPTLSCKEILCGKPPLLPHTGQMWNSSSTPGSTVAYFCSSGFLYLSGSNLSICTINGYWTMATILCKEINCGRPHLVLNTKMLWDGHSTFGSSVVYQCDVGYQSFGNNSVSFCLENGQWEKPAVVCKEIDCGSPVDKAFAKTLWDGTGRVGSVAYYECNEGYYTHSVRNVSVCEDNGVWEDIELICEAKCGPVPALARSEVVWQNRSVVLHRCETGYHSWRGTNTSICDSSTGLWRQATITCIERKPPINHLHVLNERCFHWEAEKYEEATEDYKIIFTGSRDYQSSFLDKRRHILSSKADHVKVCLNLLPVTNYSISVTAKSAKFTATAFTSTSLTVPPAPVVHYREFDNPIPTLTLQRSPSTLDPISVYQIFVLPVDGLMVFDCSSPKLSTDQYHTQYITAQIQVKNIGTEMSFTVGDGHFYQGFLNTPLENGRDYYIILRSVSEWRKESKSSCVLWAKVNGSSYVLTVSSLSSAAVVVLIALAFLGGYTYFGLFKKL